MTDKKRFSQMINSIVIENIKTILYLFIFLRKILQHKKTQKKQIFLSYEAFVHKKLLLLLLNIHLLLFC